jgi:hypothetical protein
MLNSTHKVWIVGQPEKAITKVLIDLCHHVHPDHLLFTLAKQSVLAANVSHNGIGLGDLVFACIRNEVN